MMSVNLYWRPVPKEPKDRCFAYRLKFYISEALWGHDGSLSGEWVTITKESINLSYLKGIHDETQDKDLKKEIEKLEELLNKYDEIQLSLI
jgi:hypothetical protein